MIVQRIAFNTFYLLAGKVLCGALSVVSLALIARYLGVEQYGVYIYGLVYVSIFNIICLFGVDPILIREGARDPAAMPGLLGAGMVIRGMVSIAGFAIAAAVTLLTMPQSPSVRVILILSLSLFFTCLQTPRVVFEATLRSQYLVLADLVTRVAAFLLVLAAIRRGWSVAGFAWIYVGTELAGAGLLTFLSSRFTRLALRPDPAIIRRVLRQAWPVAVTSICGVIYFRIDTVMLQYFRGSTDVAYYNCAYYLMASLMFLPESFARSIFPVMSELFTSSLDRFAEVFSRALKYLFTLAVPVALGGILLAPEIIRFLFGPAFLPAGDALRILSLALAIIFISYLVSSSITALDRQKFNMGFAIGIAVLNILLNLWVIPRWGFVGASWTTVVTEGAGCCLALAYNLRRFRLRLRDLPHWRLAGLLASAAVLVLVVRLLAGWHVLLILAASAGAYALALWILRWFDATDRQVFQQVVRGMR